jgi:Family of unknown function (DUF6455)
MNILGTNFDLAQYQLSPARLMMNPKPAAEGTVAPQTTPYPIVTKVIDLFGDWLKHRQAIREIRGLDSGEFASIAHDLRIAPADLDALVCQGPHAADELPKLLKALGIDEKALSRTQPLVLRDMARVCTLCRQKPQCDRDLDAGTSPEHYADYCLNASTIDALEQKTT